MPLVTATIARPKSAAFKAAVLRAVHDALVAAGVPPADKFQRVLELDPAHSSTTRGIPISRATDRAISC